jgi:Autophagocytosis associated protein, active-site domain
MQVSVHAVMEMVAMMPSKVLSAAGTSTSSTCSGAAAWLPTDVLPVEDDDAAALGQDDIQVQLQPAPLHTEQQYAEQQQQYAEQQQQYAEQQLPWLHHFSIAYSDSYRVPVLFLSGCKPGGCTHARSSVLQ